MHRRRTLLLPALLLLAGRGMVLAEDPPEADHAIPETPLTLTLPGVWQAAPPAMLPMVEKIFTARIHDEIVQTSKPVALFTRGPLFTVNPVYGPSIWVVATKNLTSFDAAIHAIPHYLQGLDNIAFKNRGLYARFDPIVVRWADDFPGVIFSTDAVTVEGKKIHIVVAGAGTKNSATILLFLSGQENGEATLKEFMAAMAKIKILPEEQPSAEDLVRAKAFLLEQQPQIMNKGNAVLRHQALEEWKEKHDPASATLIYDSAAQLCEQALGSMPDSADNLLLKCWGETLLDKVQMLMETGHAADVAPILEAVKKKCAAFEAKSAQDERWRLLFEKLSSDEAKAPHAPPSSGNSK